MSSLEISSPTLIKGAFGVCPKFHPLYRCVTEIHFFGLCNGIFNLVELGDE